MLAIKRTLEPPLEIDDESVEKARSTIQKIIKKLKIESEKYELSEIELSLTISASGKLLIIIAKADVKAEACIKLKITKVKSS